MEPTVTVEETSQYIKRTELDDLMGKIVSSLQPRIEIIVAQAVKQAIEASSAKTDEKIATVKGEIKGEIRGEVNARLDQHAEQERQQRQQAIDEIDKRVNRVGDDTGQKLDAFNKTVVEAKQAVEDLTKDIRGWNNSLDANQRLYDQNRRDIEKHGESLSKVVEDVGTLEETQVGTAAKLKSINHAIYGGNGDGPKSLYALIEAMNKEMEKRFTAQEAISNTTLELTRNTATRQDKYEQDLQERKQRWARRRGMALDATKEMIKSPVFRIVAILALLAIVAIFAPEALPSLIEFVQKSSNATP